MNEKPNSHTKIIHFQNTTASRTNTEITLLIKIFIFENQTVSLYSFKPTTKLKMHCCTTLVVVVVLAVTLQAEMAEAKRGCSSFGHSCYGGMGKRASDLLNTNEEILQQNIVQDDENPAFVFTGPRSTLTSNNMQPSQLYSKLSPQQYDNINRIIRQWIQSYRKAQEFQDNNNI